MGRSAREKKQDGHEAKPTPKVAEPKVKSKNSLSDKAKAKAQANKAKALQAKKN